MAQTLIRLGKCPSWSEIAGRSGHFVGFVVLWLKFLFTVTLQITRSMSKGGNSLMDSWMKTHQSKRSVKAIKKNWVLYRGHFRHKIIIVLFPISPLLWKSVGRSEKFFINLKFFPLILVLNFFFLCHPPNSVQFSFLEDYHDCVNNWWQQQSFKNHKGNWMCK